MQTENEKLKADNNDLEKKLKLCEFSAVIDVGEISNDPAFEKFIRKE